MIICINLAYVPLAILVHLLPLYVNIKNSEPVSPHDGLFSSNSTKDPNQKDATYK
jgi:hypothetical protein